MSDKPEIAIIGGGIAGMACLYLLRHKYRPILFEANNYLGGHTNPVRFTHEGREIVFDTGFMVYNEVNYPNLVRFFQELDVKTEDTSMSLSIRHDSKNLEYNGSGLGGLFAQKKNLFRPWYYRFLLEIHRFNQVANSELSTSECEITLRNFLKNHGFGNEVAELYLLPMAAAIWSGIPEEILDFPFLFLRNFLKNHGLLGLNTQHQWKTVAGSSAQYRDKIHEMFSSQIRLSTPIQKVIREETGVQILTESGEKHRFDQVIFATHADQTYQILENKNAKEEQCLKPFRYRKNPTFVHTDPGFMPKIRKNWSSWNVSYTRKGQNDCYSVTYYMNSLQKLPGNHDFFVTLDPPREIPEKNLLYRFDYTHPIFNSDTYEAAKKLPDLNRQKDIFYCGSYFQNGFHEDAFTSALHLCETLTLEKCL